MDKYLNTKIYQIAQYIEEIADVEIMLQQIKFLYSISKDEINSIKTRKVNRTIDLVWEGKSNGAR